MSAYAYYQAEMFDDCMNSAKRYVTLHPGSPDAAYAQYLIGSSYYDQIVDVSRDQQRAEKAIDALQEVVRKYPKSEYALSAQKKSAWRAISSPARRWMSGVFISTSVTSSARSTASRWS